MMLYLLLLTVLLNNCCSDASGRGPSPNATDAVSKAANYLLKRTEAEKGEKNVLPRAVVALAFAARNRIIPDALLSSLKKELNIQIYMHLSQNHLKPSLFELAQYVNALYATCQDPRSFYGMDLVAQLRNDVDSAWKPTLNRSPKVVVPPFPLLTLCIAGDRTKDYYLMLNKTFNQGGNDRLSLKALTVMALACWSLNSTRYHQPKVPGFVNDIHLEFPTTDIYTKSLSVQALYALQAWREAGDKSQLLQQYQLPDGSFGDSLSTYYAIPALLNKSLLNLRCKSSISGIREPPTTLRLWDTSSDASGRVTYSLWIDRGLLSITHSVKIGLHLNETFYDVMKRAEEENKAFSFLYDSTRTGLKVYSLADIPNDVESRKAWNLYLGFEDNVVVNSRQNLVKQTRGVDQIWPKDKDHFVFWFEQDSN